MRILAVTPISGSSGSNTSIHRVEALRELGFEVGVVDSTLNRLKSPRGFEYRVRNRLYEYGLPIPLNDLQEVNRNLLERLASDSSWNILWLEKALTISERTLKLIREKFPWITVVGFSPDDMGRRHCQSQQFRDTLYLYHHYITTKSFNVSELKSYGCPSVTFTDNGYDPTMFQPAQVTAAEQVKYGGDVGFIGSYEPERARSMLRLAETGINVRIWGNGWESFAKQNLPSSMQVECSPLIFDAFSKACSSFAINLNFLRKINRDVQTTRSVEIPATGGFMLAERTEEHERLFAPGMEADYFSSDDELIEKCRYYLENEERRRAIAHNGYTRCVSSGYSNKCRLETVLAQLEILR